ncbi:hypothetical protein [Enterocloster bolteae]|uniref:hypothetical protein n=1 Tax=Enterocloster bolteae TaxID=208479 RepID=UPI0032BF4EC3
MERLSILIAFLKNSDLSVSSISLQTGICGDSDDTGGFYLIIFHDKEQLLYWDITEAGILQQIINDDFEIEWFA